MTTQLQESSKLSDAADPDPHGPGLVQVLTLVLWVTWLVIGIIGLLTSEPSPRAPSENLPTTIQAELVNAELNNEPAPVAQVPLPSPLEQPVPESSVPPLPAVALPSPAIAFAVPVEGPVRIVDASRAGSGVPARAVVRQLTYGQGLGRQPKPDYPPEALALHQEGVVGIQFSVGEDGRVSSAWITSASWPLLNNAALRTVRQSWSLPPGVYQVSIRFQLNQP